MQLKRRLIALILSLLLIAAALPMNVSAYSYEGARLCEKIVDHYEKILEANETDTLKSLCGLLSSYQLYFLGVNSYAVMANGNDQYDCYLDSNYTSNGYRIKRYSAEDYTLEEALYAITNGGTRDAYNILVCFQATITEAGSKYGHAVVIYGIVDGKVYFTENYGTAFFEKEGMPGVCSISQFAAMYESWTTFEGVVFFGRKGYLDSCDRYYADMYVQMREDAQLYTLPCSPSTNEDSKAYSRDAKAGEYLLVKALYKNPENQYFYQVQDGDELCYLDARFADAVRFNGEDVAVSKLKIPQVLKAGEDFTLGGKISSQNGLVRSLTVTVTDMNGNAVLTHSRARKGGTYDLSRDTFNKFIDFGTLNEGLYKFILTAQVQSKYMDAGMIQCGTSQSVLCSEVFAVGENTQLPQQGRTLPQFIEDGWKLLDGKWCYYENGNPRTGWICADGLDYYLQEDGSAVTGWTEINGKARYFTASGAMYTGWLHTKDGTFYLLKNGQKATGWRAIDEERYYFQEDGTVHCAGWDTIEEKTYYFLSDGCVAKDWQELKDGTFYFDADGQLLAKAVFTDGEVTYELQVEEQVEIPPLPEKEPEE